MKQNVLRVWTLGKGILALPAVQVLFIGGWLGNLAGTDSEYSVYVLCALTGVLCLGLNRGREAALSEMPLLGLAAASFGFSLMVALANYHLIPGSILGLLKAGVLVLGGSLTVWNILGYFWGNFPKAAVPEGRNRGVFVFLLSFFAILAVSLGYHHVINYPGTISPDSIEQLNQILTGKYNNINPFYHTILMEGFYRIGFALTGNISGAIAFALDGQAVILALCFAYAVETVYEMGAPKWAAAGVFLFYCFAPYHIVYASTLWKDVLFGASALLCVTALLRILRGLGKRRISNYLVFTLGSVGFCLMRTNGWYALLVTAAVLFFLLRKQQPGVLKLLGGVLLACWIACNPVLDLLGVRGTDFVEAFAVPFQQFAYVIANGGDLTEEETEKLSLMFDLEKVEEVYTPGCVDPVKRKAYIRENQSLIQDNLKDYVNLYVKMGIKYPGSFLKAWVEETKGYWNGGYVENSYYGLYSSYVHENTLGIEKSYREGFLAELGYRFYGTLFTVLENNLLFRPLFAMGLFAWMLMGTFLLGIWKKRREAVLCVPLLVILVGLWLGTPVFSEFRYAYPLFTALPVTALGVLFAPREI